MDSMQLAWGRCQEGNVFDSQKQGVSFIASILMTDAHNSYGLGNRVRLSAQHDCCF